MNNSNMEKQSQMKKGKYTILTVCKHKKGLKENMNK